LLICFTVPGWSQPDIYTIEVGNINFTSNAPLEIIKASSSRLRGAIDISEGTFALTVPVSSFEGFNNPLQRTHFNENYMESSRYPNAVFRGKIIEEIDFSHPGQYQVRAKGNLEIHGIGRERIIRGDLKVTGDHLEISSRFIVLLREHDISIPKIVYQNIAEEIEVSISAKLVGTIQ
jgi:polyisoprenoid-binding protein YceI